MSLIADSLKKIEKGENDTPSKEQGFLAPPLMQKDFGGSNKGGSNKGGGKKGSSKLLLIIVIVVVVGVGGAGAFLYMSGMLNNLLFPEPVPIVRPVPMRDIPPVTENIQKNIPIITDNNTAVTETNPAPENIIDFIQTESAQDMNPALADNMTVANITPKVNDSGAPQSDGIIWNDNVTVAKKDNATKNNVIKNDTTSIAKKDNATKDTTKQNVKTPIVKKTIPSKQKPTTDTGKVVNNSVKKNNVVQNKLSTITPNAKDTQLASVKPKTVIPSVRKPVDINDKLTYTALIAQGEKAVDNRDYETAINVFKKAGEIDNSNVLMGNIAALYIKVAKPAVASEIVIVNKIKDPSIVSSLIIDMADNKYLVQALVLLKYATDNIPLNSQIVYAEGFYYEVQRGYVKASEYYLKAFEMNPREPAYLYAYARCLDFSEQYYKALESYLKVVAMKPDTKLKIIAEQRIRSLQGYLRSDK